MPRRSSPRSARTASLLVLVVPLLLPLGCSAFKEAYLVDSVVADSRPDANKFFACAFSPFRQLYRTAIGYPAIDTIFLNEYHFPGDGEREDLAYRKAQKSRADRDRLVRRVVSLSNDLCRYHMSGYISQQALNELGLGSAALGLTAAGSVAGGAGAVQALSAAATGVGGLRTLLNDAVYYKQLTPVLLARATVQRQALLNQIAAKLSVYSLGEDAGPAPAPTPCAAGQALVDNAKQTLEGAQASLSDATQAVAQAKAQAESDKNDKKKSEAEKGKSEAAHKTAVEKEEQAKKAVEAASKDLEAAKKEQLICRPWKDYSIDSALADLKVFHDSCSFYRALEIAEADIREKSQAIADDFKKIYEQSAKQAQTKDEPVGNKPAPDAGGEQKDAGGSAAE
jgi:hypothetical protein